MPTDDEGTRVTTRAARKRLGSIDIESAPSPNTPKKTPAAKKGTEQLPVIAETAILDAKDAQQLPAPTVNGTPHAIRSRNSLSESLATPTKGATSTPLAGLRRKPGEVSETATPGRRVTRRTSTTETFEELQLPVRRVTRRTSTASEDAGSTASPLVATRAKQRMSIATAPTDATLIEESEEPPLQNARSDSPAENTRSRVRALSHSPYNSGTDSKNTSAQETEVNTTAAKDLKVNLEDAFKDAGNAAVKVVKFDQETAGNEDEGNEASKTIFAKTPKTVKNLSYTSNTTIEVSKLMNSTSEIEISLKGDSSMASGDLDKSLEQLAQAIQQKGVPVAEESIMSSVQSPKVGKKDVYPTTPRPAAAQRHSITSSTPNVKATPAAESPKKAVTPLIEKPEIAAAAEKEKEASPTKRNHNATFAGKSSPKKKAGEALNRSWSHAVRGSSDKKIDAFGAVPESPAKPVITVPDKKIAARQKGKRNTVPRVVSSDEEDDEMSDSFEDAQCEVAPDDYQSGDSMDTSERDEMEKNEVVDDGESVGSDDSVGARDADFDEYERDSFLASDEEVDHDDMLDGTGDDLSLSGEANATPKKKRNSRKLAVSDGDLDSSNTSSEVQKKSPKKGGRIMRNPVDDSSSEEEEGAEKQELNENELEIVKRFQDTVSELAKKSRKSSTTQEVEDAAATPQKEVKPVDGTVSPAKSPKKTLSQPEETGKNDQSMNGEKSPKKALNIEDTNGKQEDAKSPPKSAKKPPNTTAAQEEQDSDDSAASDDDEAGPSDDNGDDDDDEEGGSGEETSDDDYDDIVEDSEDIEESDEEPAQKQKKKKQKSKGNDTEAKPTNMFGIKEQRLHVLLQKCHEFVGNKKDELEEAKRLTKGARETKRQERLKRKEEEAARKQAQDIEDGRTVIKKKKKRKPKKKNPDLAGDDDPTVEKELPLIVKKKMEMIEKRKQRNREKKAARKKKKVGTDTTQSNSSQSEATPTKKAATDVSTMSLKSDKKGKKKDKPTAGLSQSLQNLPTNISVAALNIQHKLAAAKAEQLAKSVEKPVKEEAPKSVEKAAEDTIAAAPPKKKKQPENSVGKPVQEVVSKPLEKVAEDTTTAAIPKKKKRQILDIVEQTLKQDKQEQSAAKPPPPKKRLKILDESGAFSTAQFDVVPVTPEAKLLKKNSGFKEAPITPEPINFKVTSILPKPQPALVKSKGGFKEAMRKKLVNIQDVDHQLPLPKWKVKPTASGEFVVTKTKRQAGDYVPLSTEGSTTQFAVATLESSGPVANGGGHKKRKVANAASAASSNAAQKFKENAILGTAQREPMKAKFRKLDKKKANASSRAGTSFNIF